MNTELDLDIRPQIQMIQQGGESKFFERQDLERFGYGELLYIKELGILAQLEPPDSKRRFRAPVRTVLKKHQMPAFMEELAEDGQNRYVLDESARNIKILKDAGELKITSDAIDRDWCWLSAQYSFDDASVSLADILEARREGKRFINTKKGWVDCNSPRFDHLDKIFGSDVTKRIDDSKGQIKLSRLELLKLCAFEQGHIQGQEDSQRASLLKRLLDLIPPEKVSPPGGLTSPLRKYQLRGMEWCFYLYKNGLGGLLCDDMGLGKTHQVMGLILLLLEKEKIKAPFLVVCPTTVLSHWEKKIRIHAPFLRPMVYHGPERNLEKELEENSVVLTSYGILWRDIAIFNKLHFTLAVFDEIQHIKNPSTRAYSAAKVIGTHMKLGLTGTPIENSLFELKALVDLTLPGYLETDKAFQERYVECPHKVRASRHEELSRLIAPITLRRIKDSVLDELPEKIEDIMTCRLSEQQVKLYKDAVSSKGRNLVDVLANSREPVPYMHIFAILNLLKQICNHPALVLEKTEKYEDYRSGKWDLFKELLNESLDSRQKVVVFSQYLGMIDIMERHLKKQGVDFVILTGASRNRGEIITSFNEDPDCRVILASLKAGGTGIDLISGSVVIHYDRWWNAAKEDQATDRVHRIGQKRVVQVFKLVTQGTLEEKISAIIDRKRNLMDDVIKEDSAELIKTFNREDLLVMLTPEAF
jgi:SNF2 family DNA or RNA helicase